jgi:hypothetical protein
MAMALSSANIELTKRSSCFSVSTLIASEGEPDFGNVDAFDLSCSDRRCELGYWILGEYEGQG